MPDTEDRFADGVIRCGCEQLGRTLSKIPLVEDFTWSGVQSRYWWARFAIRCDTPLAWGVIRRLAYCLNTSVLELWGRQPFLLRPAGEETMWNAKRRDVIYWTIESTAPLLDPGEVAEHLDRVLLSKIHEERDWIDY